MRRYADGPSRNPIGRVALLLVLLGLAAPAGLAIEREKTVQRLMDATEALKELLQIPEGGIPHSLLRSAEGIIMIPGALKGAFMVGGRHGRGILVHRMDNGKWSNPCFVTLSGGNFGFQIGGQAVDILLVVANKRGFESVLKDHFTISGDATAAVGPIGRSAEFGTDVKLKAEILSYSRSRGFFAGVSLEGARLGIDKKANAAFYGQEVDARTVLTDTSLAYVTELKPLLRILKPFSGQKGAPEQLEPPPPPKPSPLKID